MAGFDPDSIAVFEPGNKHYDDLDITGEEANRHKSTPFYDQIVSQYNQCQEGAIMIFTLPAGLKFCNLKNVFKGRGLEAGVDVLIARQEVDENGDRYPSQQRPVKIKRMSEKEGRVIDKAFQQAQD